MTAGGLDRRLTALAEATALARGRLDRESVAAAEAVVARAGVRLGLGVEATVVALAGPTGAGKSSLFNALAGAELVTAGHLRPTTSVTTAAVWGEIGDPLLDWLAVQRRHRRTGGPDGLILLDLPDFDSVRLEHREEVERVVALADLMVWVVDPQKYADAALHERYLRRFARHGGTMLVVLNQADRLDARAPRPASPTSAGCWRPTACRGCRCWRSPRGRARASLRCGRSWTTGSRRARPRRRGWRRTSASRSRRCGPGRGARRRAAASAGPSARR